ncbi:MAG: FAD-dependent oxidoreductase [Gammaproteobacteria bacterium]|nr:MAG: FAD-dependent oxidoreductase [Gammaproteobacteria bacterium]
MKLTLLNRPQQLDKLSEHAQWDIVVIGGGITGAGILKLASQLGLKALLVEQQDFAWGSSSRSSKMVHGGLRYIAQGQVKLTQESILARQQLLAQAPNLVTEQSFVMGHYKKQFPWPWLFNSLLSVYDFLAGKAFAEHHSTTAPSLKKHHRLGKAELPFLTPHIKNHDNLGGSQFFDAMTDDARLVLRLIQEAQQLGALAINYCQAESLIYDQQHKVVGVNVQLEESQQSLKVNSKVVINATGAWAEQLLSVKDNQTSQNKSTSQLKHKISIRPLRGSHIIVPNWRLPVASVVTILHAQDQRPVQVFPWQNVTVIGTTDVEHQQSLLKEPKISAGEFDYLMAAVTQQFPSIKLTAADVISTFAGVRPVVATGGLLSPSQEKRDHSLWQQAGLVTVAGGKITTFNLIAQQVLTAVAGELNLTTPLKNYRCFAKDAKLSTSLKTKYGLAPYHYQHFQGCYGDLANDFLQQAEGYQLKPISYSSYLWAELVWAVRFEQVQHLDDLLLRRTRLGNVLPDGAIMLMPQIKTLCQAQLKWSDDQWFYEQQRYHKIWQNYYSLPKVNRELGQLNEAECGV